MLCKLYKSKQQSVDSARFENSSHNFRVFFRDFQLFQSIKRYNFPNICLKQMNLSFFIKGEINVSELKVMKLLRPLIIKC